MSSTFRSRNNLGLIHVADHAVRLSHKQVLILELLETKKVKQPHLISFM